MFNKLPLQDLLEFTRDGEWGKGEPADNLVKMAVIRGTDFAAVRVGNISSVPIRYIPKKIADRKMLCPGDVLLETAGGTKDQPTGRTVYLSKRVIDAFGIPVTCASFSRFLRVKSNLIDPRYLFWYLQSIYKSGEMLPYHVQHTGVARFQYTDFAAQWHVPLQTMTRQVEIADVLTSLDDRIELNRRMNETLEAMAQAIFRDWFVDFGPTRRKGEGASNPVEIMGGLVTDAERAQQLADLFPASFGENGLPEGWEPCVASDLIEFNPREPLKKGSTAPYTDMSSLPTSGSIAEEPVQREFGSGMRFRNGDALLARITPCLENGKAAFVDFLPHERTVGWGSTEFYVLRARDGVPPPIAYLLVRLPDFRTVAISSMTGTSGRQRAQVDRLEAFPMVRPDRAVVAAFGSFVEPMFEKISANGRENRSLAAARDLLLPKLMSGEIRLREAEAELEAAQ
ncbi:restriction endonuclease subunit S [Sinorhizobium fredii]|uniref:restriction endonuclease subunit S n=1 Tax=Rhizobium fredii TaxID=380 RepID=UPI00351978C2